MAQRSHWEPFVESPQAAALRHVQGDRLSAVTMEPTSFRTYALPALGTTGAVRIVGAAPYAQRVVFGQPFVGLPPFPGVPLISFSSSELNGINAIVGLSSAPAGAGVPRGILVLAPDQALYGASQDAAVLPGATAFLSVAVSQVVPMPTEPWQQAMLSQPGSFATHRRYPLAPTGTRNAARQIIATTARPQRVVIKAPVGGVPAPLVRISSNPAELDMPGPPSLANPSGAFTWLADELRVFITAPGQPLYASIDAGGAGDQTISVSANEVNPQFPRGATGIPGPDSQE